MFNLFKTLLRGRGSPAPPNDSKRVRKSRTRAATSTSTPKSATPKKPATAKPKRKPPAPRKKRAPAQPIPRDAEELSVLQRIEELGVSDVRLKKELLRTHRAQARIAEKRKQPFMVKHKLYVPVVKEPFNFKNEERAEGSREFPIKIEDEAAPSVRFSSPMVLIPNKKVGLTVPLNGSGETETWASIRADADSRDHETSLFPSTPTFLGSSSNSTRGTEYNKKTGSSQSSAGLSQLPSNISQSLGAVTPSTLPDLIHTTPGNSSGEHSSENSTPQSIRSFIQGTPTPAPRLRGCGRISRRRHIGGPDICKTWDKQYPMIAEAYEKRMLDLEDDAGSLCDFVVDDNGGT